MIGGGIAAAQRPRAGRTRPARRCARRAEREPRGRGAPGDVRLVAVDQQRPEHRQPEAGAEVPDGLGDPGDLAVAVLGSPVEGIGAGGAEHQPDPSAGEQDRAILGAQRQVGQLVGEQPEADRRQRAAEHHGRAGAAPVEDAPPTGPARRSRGRSTAGRRRLRRRSCRARSARTRWRRRSRGRTRTTSAAGRRCRRRSCGLRKIRRRSRGTSTRSSQSTKATIVSAAHDEAPPRSRPSSSPTRSTAAGRARSGPSRRRSGPCRDSRPSPGASRRPASLARSETGR